MAAMSPLEMFSIDLSPAIGRCNSSKVSVITSRASSGDDNLAEWRSVITSRYKAGKEFEARRKAQPEPLIPSCSVSGFVEGALAGGKTLGSSKLEGSRLSDFDEHVSTHPVRRALLTQDSLDKLKLEERRQKLSDAADESQEFSLGLGPAEIQLSGPTINLAASHENKPLNFEVLHETEVLAVCHAQTSAEACNNCSTKEETQPWDVEMSSFQALQLQHAATSSSPAQLSKPLPSSSSSSSCSSTETLKQIPAATFTHMPVNTVDRLLNGGTSATETCSRRKSKTPTLPRTKSTCSRHTKQTPPALRQPLLLRTCTAHIPDAAVASDAHMHPYVPLQNVDSQPSCGVWQKLSNSLSAVWRWLCKSGGGLMKLGRKVRKKLMAALGLGQEEVQRLLAIQQTEEREALTVRADRSMHHMEEPWGRSTLQRWRI